MRALLPFALLGVTAVAACSRDKGTAPVVDAEAPAITKAAVVDAGVARDAGVAPTSSVSSAALSGPEATDPFGIARSAPKIYCAGVAGKHVSERDLKTSFVDGNDLLAIANRSPTGQLAPDWAPSDLVDIRTGQAQTSSDCEKVQCLRKEAATALDVMLGEMKRQGFPGKVESAYRSYGAQCGTFQHWARKGSFCDATEQSALPGHSQHQLGTTVDLFTEEWAKDERGVFREGFGCTPAGRYIREHAADFGFVMPYPIHPYDRHPRQSCVVRWDIPVNIDPRTGYRFEHWHIRYVGKEAAARFTKALLESGPGTAREISVEQWLRAEKGITGADAELPVCDGCNCGACATLASPGESSCDKKGGALHLDEHGKPLPSAVPTLETVKRGTAKKWHGRVVDVKLDIPIGVLTQPPLVSLDGAGYETGATFERLSPYPDTEPRSFPPLAGTWMIGVEPVPNTTGVAYPWRAGLAAAIHGRIYDRANVVLPAHVGATTVKIPIPKGVTRAKVVLLESGAARGEERVLDFE